MEQPSSSQGRLGPSSSRDPLLTVQQLAVLEGLDQRHVRNLIERHGLPCYRIHASARGPRGVKIRLSEYRAWLEARRQL